MGGRPRQCAPPCAVDEPAEEFRRVVDEYLSKADAAGQRAIQLDPNMPELYDFLSQRYRVVGKLLEAEAYASRAIALDLGLPWQITKAFALIGRTLGAVAHIGEEIRNPMAENINAAIKAQMVYDFDSK